MVFSADGEGGMVKCVGVNSCAGMGECGAADGSHDCGGKNSCKGKGGCGTGPKDEEKKKE
jgi:hypothetical protein